MALVQRKAARRSVLGSLVCLEVHESRVGRFVSHVHHPTMFFVVHPPREELVELGMFQCCHNRCQGHSALSHGLLVDLRRQDLGGC